MLHTQLKNLRISSGKTQSELATALNISRSAYALYEGGKRQPNCDALCALASYYGVSLDFLCGRSDDPQPPLNLAEEERKLLGRYRALDPRGRDTVRTLLELELRHTRRKET